MPTHLQRLSLTAAAVNSLGLGVRLSPCDCIMCGASFWGTVQELHLAANHGSRPVVLRGDAPLAALQPVLGRPSSILVWLDHLLPAMRSCTSLALTCPAMLLCYGSAGAPAAVAAQPAQPVALRFLSRLAWLLESRPQLRQLTIEARDVVLGARPVVFDPDAWLRLKPARVPVNSFHFECGHGFIAAYQLLDDGTMCLRMQRSDAA
ncbi:hypothetical protein COHA_003746 [Chlorella ohadii]|uniref:Uncharacterized protein n=1 Tax=Chlorella ohadii TaxID=2649997 RepID=A0AAD5DQZ2_9CHLO|nr:hypothetical protein COHA_003746 [Chlorella ohadii]